MVIDQVDQSLEAAEGSPPELPEAEKLAAEAEKLAAEAEMQVVAAEILAGEMSVAVAGLARRQQCSRQLVGQNPVGAVGPASAEHRTARHPVPHRGVAAPCARRTVEPALPKQTAAMQQEPQRRKLPGLTPWMQIASQGKGSLALRTRRY